VSVSVTTILALCVKWHEGIRTFSTVYFSMASWAAGVSVLVREVYADE